MPLKTVKDLCKPQALALDFALGDQIEDVSAAIGDEAAGEAFFKKNYLTAGMQTLLEMGLKRLDGRDKQAVFELTQAMGGGKIHTMIAFGLLARHPNLRKTVVPEPAKRRTFGSATVVSFSGRNPDCFLWGEIAAQPGKLEAIHGELRYRPRAKACRRRRPAQSEEEDGGRKGRCVSPSN